MEKKQQNSIVVAGPTASGKTALGVRLATLLGGEILSADSRQVYVGLDIGSGKDLEEYVVEGSPIPYHLINIANLSQEFSVFHYQQAFYEAYDDVRNRGRLPVIVGGTGMYLDAILCGYRMLPTPENAVLRQHLNTLDLESLAAELHRLKPTLHNTSDLADRERLIRAIEIADYARRHPPPPAPKINALILVILHPPAVLRERIAERLRTRLDAGLIEEVEGLHHHGIPWERLELLGLEYRFVAQFLQGRIKSKNDLFQKLNSAIAQFAKRQRTWFRGMERRGMKIHWLHGADIAAALEAVRSANNGPHPD